MGSLLTFFRPEPHPPTFTPLTDLPASKMGLYALGSRDVVMSLDLLNVIVQFLETGAPADRQKALAEQLREAYAAPFV